MSLPSRQANLIRNNDTLASIIHWLTNYADSPLTNEAEVEAKFILPFFKLLGYPDNHLRSKLTVSFHVGSQGRKHEADFVYFSVAEHSKQDSTTALVIIEAKHPAVDNLSKALAQARSYCVELRPILIVVTNGIRLVVHKRHRFREDEVVFDGLITDLRNAETLAKIYDLVNFESLCRLRTRLVDELALDQLIELDQTLQAYPEVRTILARSDFHPETTHSGRELTIVRPKAAITGLLPMAFGEGECSITFSNVLRRGLSIHIDHATILSELMIGRDTPLFEPTRRYIHQIEDGAFQVQLGSTSTLLSQEEAQNLCACIDDFVGAYQQEIYDTEDVLQTWERQTLTHHDNRMFYLCSVQPWLWRLIAQFAEGFEWGRGDSEWHIFENFAPALRISHHKQDHVFVYGLREVPDQEMMPTDHEHLFYCLPTVALQYTADLTKSPWQQSIGAQGLWTLPYTQHWIEQKLIPRLQEFVAAQDVGHYQWESALRMFPAEVEQQRYTTLDRLENPTQLIPYLLDIHQWFAVYGAERMPTQPFRKVVEYCLELARYADPDRLNLHYISSHMGGIEEVDSHEYTAFQYGNDSARAHEVYVAILAKLRKYANTLAQLDSEHHDRADFRTRALITILEEGEIRASQSVLNKAAEAVTTLWRQARFEQRHCRVFTQR